MNYVLYTGDIMGVGVVVTMVMVGRGRLRHGGLHGGWLTLGVASISA